MRAIGSRSAWRTLVVLGVPSRGNGILAHAVDTIELFSLSGPSAPVGAGCSVALEPAARSDGLFRPLSQWGSGGAQPAGGNAIEGKRTRVCIRSCFGGLSPSDAMRPR